MRLFASSAVSSFRLIGVTMLVCVLGYSLIVLGAAQLFPDTARGSLLVSEEGVVIGSRLIGQSFSDDSYFWPRPSNAGGGYDAMAAAGSNKSPTSPDLTVRAEALVARYGATPDDSLPADLAAASGGGLDPHITVRAALYQVARVADARELAPSRVEALIERLSFSPGGVLTSERLVNVLELNLALDAEGGGA